ncbi:MAG: TldD/PmbA family protein [Candidatus Lokiarchaeota archaeon]|jgi:PmbA protein
MTYDKLDIIENVLKSQKIEEYEIYLLERNILESMLLKNKRDLEREIIDFEYFIRVLSQDNGNTGVGVIKGNSLDPQQLERNIKRCVGLSKVNIGPKYHFPQKSNPPNIHLAEDKLVKNPLTFKNELVENLISNCNDLKDLKAPFGRFRTHIHHNFLRNSNNINLDSLKTFYFIELSLKAEKNGALSEFWDVTYYKNKEHLKFDQRIKEWANMARDTLDARVPEPRKDAIVIFSPNVLSNAINPVVGSHSLAKFHFEKISRFEVDQEVASNQLSLSDDGLLEGGLSSNPWDAEGIPHQKTTVIENGVFRNRLYDHKYALLDGVKSTGNAKRSNDGAVSNGISNFIIKAGDISRAEMISEIKEGYYIQKFSWLNPNPVQGFFGAEIRNGYYIKDGAFKYPIKLGNVSGNVLEMIKQCLYISKEREFCEDSYFPYIAFKNLTVSS